MPALLSSAVGMLAKRQYDDYDGCPDGYTQSGDYCYSPWLLYGRWILLGGVIIGAFLLFCLCSCLTARRRKRAGRPPMYGTGWAAGNQAYPQNENYGQNQGYYGANNNNAYGGGQAYGQNQTWQQPPPQYNQAQDGSHYGKRDAQPYGGGQQSGSVELQSPGQSYQRGGGEAGYAPPAGPPPGKGDGIIR